MDELTFTRDDLRFDAIASGPADGPLVLLLHGFPQMPTSWRDVLPRLAAEGYRAVAPAQRGYSPAARPRANAAYRLDELVADVLAFADQLGARRFSVVGHDWGGAVAWALGAAHPDRVESLTVVSTPHPRAMRSSLSHPSQLLRSSYIALFRTPTVAETILGAGRMAVLRTMLERSGLPEGHARDAADAMRSPGALTAALRWYRAARPSDLEVGPISVPTLFVWGAQDPALGRLAAERTADHVTGPYTFVPMEDEGHWIPERRPDRLADLLLAHLSGEPARH
jgi:pimeloyl-ACP methyl ester carboxylesterase